ncbi:thioredoxin H2-2-like [Miscanthus floridulus]|uniref:thioredoxin H2-2-like n=1 Tax=Miscanthus floridulus TaxID=154761 RepID=UPI00345AA4DB
MGSFLSTLLTPPPAADDPNCAVVAAHSKATYDEQWAAHKSSGKLMVIDFSASWCGPCRFIEPAFKELASRFTDAIFVKIDVDELAEVARTWKVEAMPTFVLVKDGKEVSRVIGAKKDELERKIRMFTSSSSS